MTHQCHRTYPTVAAPSHCGSRAHVFQDLVYVIIDVFLLRRCLTTIRQGCADLCASISLNELMRSCQAQASPAFPNTLITSPLVCGHLLQDGYQAM